MSRNVSRYSLLTNTDIEELKEMAALMDPDEQIGPLRRIEDMDTGASGLKDRPLVRFEIVT